MTNSPAFHQTHRPANDLAAVVINGLVSQTETEYLEAWIQSLAKYAEEDDRAYRSPRDAGIDSSLREVRGSLQKLEAGPWRSLGGYLDYSHWDDRDRFLELDRAIAASRELHDSSIDPNMEMF